MNNENDTAWHLDKKVPLVLIGAILTQTFTFGWYASSISTRVAVLEGAQAATLSEFSKLETAREQSALTVTKIADQADSILELVRRNETRNIQRDNAVSPNR